jgi:hypothetical protein
MRVLLLFCSTGAWTQLSSPLALESQSGLVSSLSQKTDCTHAHCPETQRHTPCGSWVSLRSRRCLTRVLSTRSETSDCQSVLRDCTDVPGIPPGIFVWKPKSSTAKWGAWVPTASWSTQGSVLACWLLVSATSSKDVTCSLKLALSPSLVSGPALSALLLTVLVADNRKTFTSSQNQKGLPLWKPTHILVYWTINQG